MAEVERCLKIWERSGLESLVTIVPREVVEARYAAVLTAIRALVAASSAPGVPFEPDQGMLVAAREWSRKFVGAPIGNKAARGCWQAMWAAAPAKGVDLHAVAKEAAERAGKNAGVTPELLYAPILWAMQDATPQPPAAEAGTAGITGLEKSIADNQGYYDEFVRGLTGREPTARPIGDDAEVVDDIETANRSLLADIHVKLDAMISQARGCVTASASTSPAAAELIEAARAIVDAYDRDEFWRGSPRLMSALRTALDRLTQGGDRG